MFELSNPSFLTATQVKEIQNHINLVLKRPLAEEVTASPVKKQRTRVIYSQDKIFSGPQPACGTDIKYC